MTGAGRAPTRRERTGRAIFLLSAFFLLFVAAFSYGYFVARTRSFPNRLISQAMTDVDAVVDLVRGNAHEIVSSRKQGGVTVHDAALAQPGLTFFTAFDGEVFQPFLVDIDGRVVHRWKTVYGVLFKGNEEFDLLWDSRRHMHGAHLYPDGSIVASFEYRGLVKLDRCSRTLWLLKRRTHHAILPQADGSFWTPSTDTYRERPHLPQGHREDSLLHVSTDGKVLEEINLIDAVMKGGYQAILMQGEPWRPDNDSLDPLHLNDVEIVTEALARRIPQAAPGDFLVSLAHPNALAIIGRESKSVVWSLSGPFLRQHDPDIVDDGTLLVFDNRTEHWQRTPVRWLEEPQVWGYSRILRIDPGTQQVLWSFAGSRTFPFYSSAMGKQQLLANGNILVSDPEGGRAFEIAPAHGNRVVWEYVNMLEGRDEGHLGRVTEATRYDSDGTQFLDRPCD